MPTYEYECDACEHTFEEFQSMKDEPLKKCPECGKKKLRRLFGTGAAIIFKGSGFYETDYRSESYKKGAQADKEATTSSDSSKNGESTKTDTTAKTSSEKSVSGGESSKSKT